MGYTPPDWHREDIKAAIRRAGLTLTALSLQSGYAENAVRVTLMRPWPAVQAIIGKHLGIPPQSIWPSRYDADGAPKRKATGRRRNLVPENLVTHRKTGAVA